MSELSVYKIINKYKDIGSEKYDDEITKIYEALFESSAKNFDPKINDNFVAYFRLGWKKFKAEEKVEKLLKKAPLTSSNFYDSKGEEVDSVKKRISNADDRKNFSNVATAEFNMLMSDLCLSFDVSNDLLLSTLSGNIDPCDKRAVLNKMARMAAQNETNIKTAQLLGSTLHRRNWWVEWAEKKM